MSDIDAASDDRPDFDEPTAEQSVASEKHKELVPNKKRKAPSEKVPRKKRDANSEPRRRRTTVPKTATKIEKMRMKHLNEAMRDPQRIIDATMRNNETADVVKIRTETMHLQQQATAALRELDQLTKQSDRSRDAVKQHADLRAQAKRAKQMASEGESTVAVDAMQELVLDKCVDALVAQASTISKLHGRMGTLVRLFAENTAKCEAAARRSQQLAYAPNSYMIDARRDAESTETAVVAGNDNLFSLQISNGTMDLTTRPAPHHIVGRPGSSYINFSVARKNGSAQQLSQSSVVRRMHNIQRLAKLKHRTNAASKLLGAQAHLNGDDAILALTDAQSGASVPRLTNGGGNSATTTGRKK